MNKRAQFLHHEFGLLICGSSSAKIDEFDTEQVRGWLNG